MIPTADGARLDPRGRCRDRPTAAVVAPDGEGALDLGLTPDDLRLHPSAVRAGAATTLPAGWVLLAPEGRLPADATTDRPQLRHVPDGSTVQLDEALR